MFIRSTISTTAKNVKINWNYNFSFIRLFFVQMRKRRSRTHNSYIVFFVFCIQIYKKSTTCLLISWALADLEYDKNIAYKIFYWNSTRMIPYYVQVSVYNMMINSLVKKSDKRYNNVFHARLSFIKYKYSIYNTYIINV